jgi:hypothetical protein
MLDRIYRMKKYHSWSGKPNHDSDPVAAVRFVTLRDALLTRRFGVSEFAMLQPPVCVVFQLLTILTQRLALSMMKTAIDVQHLGNCLFLAIVHRFTLKIESTEIVRQLQSVVQITARMC